jgi:hypothetical protein
MSAATAAAPQTFPPKLRNAPPPGTNVMILKLFSTKKHRRKHIGEFDSNYCYIYVHLD